MQIDNVEQVMKGKRHSVSPAASTGGLQVRNMQSTSLELTPVLFSSRTDGSPLHPVCALCTFPGVCRVQNGTRLKEGSALYMVTFVI